MKNQSTLLILSLMALTQLTGCELDILDDSPKKNNDSAACTVNCNACGPEHAVAFQAQTHSTDFIAAVKEAEYGDGSNVEFIEDGVITETDLLSSVETDYAISSRNGYFYYLGKHEIDTFQKYYYSSPETGLYQTANNLGYSTREAGEITSPNAYNITFINDSIAIMPRYADSVAWLIDTTAQSEADFKICEIDLSAYEFDTTDNENKTDHHQAKMFKAEVTSNYAAITLQRLEGFNPTQSAYMAIFDLNTWEEVDTNPAEQGLKGIELSLKNPQSTASHGDTIYVASLVYSDNSGGIEKVDLTDFSHETINNESGYSSVAVTDNGNLYALNYAGWKNNTLFQITESSRTVISGTESKFLSSLSSRQNTVWLGHGLNNSDQPKIELFDATSNNKVSTITSLSRSPVGIAFIEK